MNAATSRHDFLICYVTNDLEERHLAILAASSLALSGQTTEHVLRMGNLFLIETV